MSLQNPIENHTEEEIIKSGQVFKVDGFYKFAGHTSGDTVNCYVPDSAYFMLFRKGQIASKLASCEHEVCWKLIMPY